MKYNPKEIIEAGCSVKEIKPLDEMKRLKKHPFLIKAKEFELYATAVYRLNMIARGKNRWKDGA